MNSKNTYSRFIILAVVLLIMMCALIYQLGILTIANGDEYALQAYDRTTRTITTSGTRGKILDRNGLVLAYDETTYNIDFQRDAAKRTDYYTALYTESLIKAIEIIESYGYSTIDTSYLKMDENGNIYYDFGVQSETAIAARYKNFRNAMGFTDEDITAEEAYLKLRAYWFIPEDLNFEEANKVISIRQEVNLNNYKAYAPVTIAYDVGIEVIAEITMRSDELLGLQTSQSTTRVYPHGTTAAHIIGYQSRSVNTVTASYLENLGFSEEDYASAAAYNEDGSVMTDEDGNPLYNMLKMGYSYNDYIGVSGVEATMERYLTGATNEHKGTQIIEVNDSGSTIREISSTYATNGNDVMLTIDLQLQKVTETALETLINKIAADEQKLIDEDEDGKYSKLTKGDTSKIDTAKTGAIVVIDVNNGDILSMASYPSYDPNWFIDGLSVEQSDMLFGEAAADTTPMRNKAISAKLAPGSIFKPATGLAGALENVIGLDETIDCEYVYYYQLEDGSYITTNPAHCWTKNYTSHAAQNLTRALTNSCNYYFFEVAKRLGIDLLNEWSEKLGLSTATGIELTGEATGIIGGQTALYDNTLLLNEQKSSLPNLVYRQLKERLKAYLSMRSMEIDDIKVSSCALKLMELQDGSIDGKGPQIRRIMSDELGLPEGWTLANNCVSDISSLLNEIQWKPTQTIRAGIGQGISLVTPIAVARYIAAIANSGTVYDTHIVDRILDSNSNVVLEVEPTVYNTIEADDAVWSAIKAGMNGVVSPEDGGTASDAWSENFKNAGYLDRIAGKTGSAQIGTNNLIDIENTSWFVTYTPRDNAEIAIVICVPNGYAGKWSASAAEEILTYYFEKQESSALENLSNINSPTM